MSNIGKLRKSLFYFSAFSGLTGCYLAGSMVSSFHWIWRVIILLAAVVMGCFGFWEYQDIIELYEETGSDASSSGREVIPVEVENSP